MKEHQETKLSTSHKAFCALSKLQKEAEYKRRVDESLDLIKSLYSNTTDWKLEHGSCPEHGLVYTQHHKKAGKLYKLEGYLDTRAETAFCQLVHLTADTPSWNPNVQECRILETFNNNMDVVYNVSTAAMGGLVSSRDFVDVRHWQKEGDTIYSVGAAAFHPEAPENNKYVRGENQPSSLIFKEEPGNRCLFTMIIRISLKGWLPHRLVDQAMIGTFTSYFKSLKGRMENIQQLIQQSCHVCSHAPDHAYVHALLTHVHNEHVQSQTSVHQKNSKNHKMSALHGLFHHKCKDHNESEGHSKDELEKKKPRSKDVHMKPRSSQSDLSLSTKQILERSQSTKEHSTTELTTQEKEPASSIKVIHSTDLHKSTFWKKIHLGTVFKKHKHSVDEKEVSTADNDHSEHGRKFKIHNSGTSQYNRREPHLNNQKTSSKNTASPNYYKTL